LFCHILPHHVYRTLLLQCSVAHRGLHSFPTRRSSDLWLLAAGVGRPDRFAPPVVVQLVDAIDEDEARLGVVVGGDHDHVPQMTRDRKSTRLNSSHVKISYAVFCLKKKTTVDISNSTLR